jgi:hypothetical protein
VDTNEKQDLMLCENALKLYPAIEAAIEQGRNIYEKDRLKDLLPLLKEQTQHCAFGPTSPSPSSRSLHPETFCSEKCLSQLRLNQSS